MTTDRSSQNESENIDKEKPEHQARVIPLFPDADSQPSSLPSEKTRTKNSNNSLEMIAPLFLTGTAKILLFVLTLTFLANILPKIITNGFTSFNTGATALIAALILAVLAFRARQKPEAAQRIVLGTSHAIFPKNPHNKSFYSIPYEEIRAVMRLDGQEDESILIDTRKRLYSFTSSQFTSPHAPTLLWASLLSKIRTLEDGEARLHHFNELAQSAYLASHNRTIVTRWMFVAICVAFIIQIATGSILNPFHMLDLGANNPILVANGQWFRLISANFLHAGWPHILINGMSLLFLGSLVERLIGSRKTLLVYLVSAIAGTAASAIYGIGVLSVGASTALFGLLGAFAIIHLKYRTHLPPPYRQTRRWWFVILSLNALLPLLIPQIDVAAHAGGFFAGAAITVLLLLGASDFEPNRAPSRALRAACIVAVAICTAAFIQTAAYSISNHPADDTILTDDYIARAKIDGPQVLQALAKTTAFDPNATPHRLELALRAAKEAQKINPDDTELLRNIIYLQARIVNRSGL